MRYDLFDTESGNAVVIALDHGLGMGAVEGFEDPAATLDAVLAGEPDGVLVGPAFARHYGERIDSAAVETLVTADVVTFSTRPGHDEGMDIWTRPFDVDELLAVDPVGVKAVLVFGRDDRRLFERNIEAIGRLGRELRGTGVPLIVEPVQWGPRVPEQFETDHRSVEHACRLAWEYGADILKAPYTGDQDAYTDLVEHSPVPVTILGGPASGSTRAMLGDIRDAVDAGAHGPVIGRSVWQADDPAAVTRALGDIVHEGASVNEVWE
ncbi:fructose-1,6-bisphosphate aldolase [Halobacteriales archaeon QS_4_62_28]|nr:MAG: fructose-1,6-bisphosphate aldolase [Halobacteriales archaeon QS_4_62_28]